MQDFLSSIQCEVACHQENPVTRNLWEVNCIPILVKKKMNDLYLNFSACNSEGLFIGKI